MKIKLTAADLSKWVSFGTCRIKSIYGFNNQGSDLYIQLFERSAASASVVVANGAIPEGGSIMTQQANGFKYEWENGLGFAELTIGISSTESSMTAVAAAGGLDFVIEVDGVYLVDQFPTIAIAGDLTTAVAGLAVWLDAAGPHTLMKIDAINSAGAVRTILGYAEDSPNANTSKLQFMLPMPAAATQIKYNCGQGFIPFSKTASDQALHNGLTLINTSIGNVATDLKIRAIYI